MIIPTELPATEKLFHKDPALCEARARVVRVQGDLAVLDRSLFYAESGGQVSDHGTIAGVPVVAVSKQGGRPVRIERPGLDTIYVNTGAALVHKLAEPLALAEGEEVALALDGARRAAVTRHHSAAHFLFFAIDSVVAETEGRRIDTRGCLIDEEGFRFDVANALPPERLGEVEARANALIEAGARILMDPDEACDDVFYWRCGDLVVPCGGTHVAHARDLSPIVVTRRSKGRSSLRLSGRFAA